MAIGTFELVASGRVFQSVYTVKHIGNVCMYLLGFWPHFLELRGFHREVKQVFHCFGLELFEMPVVVFFLFGHFVEFSF